MNQSQPSPDTRPTRFSLSLGTLFLIVACAAIAAAVFRDSSDESFLRKCGVALIFVGAFLAMWFTATLQFKMLRFAGILLAVGLVLIIFLDSDAGVTSRYRPSSSINIKEIGLALLNYHRDYGRFPPAFVADARGKPLYSWRMLILPYLEEQHLAKSIRRDEAWDGPNNVKLAQTDLEVFSCPENRDSTKPPPTTTAFLAVVGPHTAWAGAKPRKLSDFKDPSKTILIVEVDNSGINWAEPRDLYIGQMPPEINPAAGQGISSVHRGGALVLFADCHVESLPNTTDPKKLAEMLDLDGCNDQSAIDGDSR